jgi:tetratricopeptide (TPR) repeat protein/transcriptional regulator with XRE-family HTH domain
VAEGLALDFGALLRRLRTDAGLTQEELAEAAQLSPRSISDLERGINLTARKQTARLLADALSMAGPERAMFESAARGRDPAVQAPGARYGALPAVPAAAMRMLPRDVAGFTGRAAELGRLLAVLDDTAPCGGVVGIHAIGGMAGIGKTTLAVHAAHRLAGRFPDGQIFLPLHAHTPGQRPVNPADALASLLEAAGIDGRRIPAGLEARAACWRDYLAGRKVLLVLDDAAGHEQVRPLLPGAAGSLVLITSRRRLAALEDAAVISLGTLSPEEAVALLARLADRPELAASTGPAGDIARLCGYLPLAIGMLARQLQHHPSWTSAALAADLAAAKERLELIHAENLSVAAAFGLSYRDLTAGQRRLFRALGLHPGPDIDGYAAAALAGTGLAAARRNLGALYDQHLITEPARGRYRLHDLIREHARALAADDDPAGRDAAAGRLLDYYLHTALAASTHIPALIAARARTPAVQPPAHAPQISGPSQATAWLEAERANLHAAVDYAAASARTLHATGIAAAIAGFLYLRGHWDEAIALQQTALTAARQAEDRPGQARALLLLGGAQVMTSDFPAGIASLTRALVLYRDLGDQAGQGEALNSLGLQHHVTADYPAAADCHQQALALFRDIGHRRGQAESLNELGSVHLVSGKYPAAKAFLQQALDLFRAIGHRSGEGDALTDLGVVQRLTGDYPSAAASLQQALMLYRDLGDRYKQAFAVNEIGVVLRLTGDYAAAVSCHQQALEQFSDLSELPGQGYARNELGLAQQLSGDYVAAAASHREALRLFLDLGDRYGQAETLNSLGELSSRSPANQQGRDQHAQAAAIARDIGAPMEEARALEGIGRCHLQAGHVGEGVDRLQEALTIYQRIGAPGTRRVQATLRGYGTKRSRSIAAPEP